MAKEPTGTNLSPEDLDALMEKQSKPQALGTLSEADLEEARRQAREEVDREARKAAMAAAVDAEKARLKREDGFITGKGAMDERVKVLIDLPEHSDRLTVNGVEYWHNYTYDVPRHVANSLRESMQRGWDHQNQIDGKDLRHNYLSRKAQVLNGNTGQLI